MIAAAMHPLLLGGVLKPARPLTDRRLVSVVIPCYNYGRFLEACVNSVRTNQPGIGIDIVIVDDCSSDDSLEIARRLQAGDDRIRIIAHASNRGHIATYNEGLAAARGEFVLLLSADDLVAPGGLVRAAALLASEPSVGLVYGRAIDFCGTPPAARTRGSTWIVWRGTEWLRVRCRLGYNVVSSPTAMMRTSVLRAIGDYRADLPHAGDFEMWLRAASASDIGFLVGVDQAFYRNHATNMNRTQFHSGTALGQLIDIKQRLACFEAVLSDRERLGPEAERLLYVARRTLATKALAHVNYAYARGNRTFPFEAYEAFSIRTLPAIRSLKAWRAMTLRKKFGLLDLPLHPLWAFSAIGARLAEAIRRWRYRNVGV